MSKLHNILTMMLVTLDNERRNSDLSESEEKALEDLTRFLIDLREGLRHPISKF